MLKIDGKDVLLRVGETSDLGVFLVSADSKQAVVLIGDQEHRLNLSSRIGAEFKTPVRQTVSVLLEQNWPIQNPRQHQWSFSVISCRYGRQYHRPKYPHG